MIPRTVAHHDKSPKNKRNPKPSPIGNNFGFLSFGSRCWVSEEKTLDKCFRRTVGIKQGVEEVSLSNDAQRLCDCRGTEAATVA